MKKLLSGLLALFLAITVPSNALAAETPGDNFGTEKVAVFLLNMPHDPTYQPFTPEQMRQTVFDGSISVAAYYEDTSYGQLHLIGDVFGWYTMTRDNTSCFYAYWRDEAIAQATAQGVDLSQYSRFVFWFPSSPGCGFGGIAQGNYTYINGVTGGQVIAHELGHTFGSGHASRLLCYDDVGNVVSVSYNCTRITYGDPYEVMGNSGYYTMNATHRTQLGWLPLSHTQNIPAGSNGNYTVLPLEYNVNGIQQLQIFLPKQGQRSLETYCVEFRQSFGWDNFHENDQYGNPWATRGILIRQGLFNCTAPQSTETWLLDGTPNTPVNGATFWDIPLPVGQIFTHPKFKLQLLSADSSGATVKLTYTKGNSNK